MKVTYIWCASWVVDGTRKKQLAPSVDEQWLTIISDIMSSHVTTMPMCCNHNGGKQGHEEKGASHVIGLFHSLYLILYDDWKKALSELMQGSSFSGRERGAQKLICSLHKRFFYTILTPINVSPLRQNCLFFRYFSVFCYYSLVVFSSYLSYFYVIILFLAIFPHLLIFLNPAL